MRRIDRSGNAVGPSNEFPDRGSTRSDRICGFCRFATLRGHARATVLISQHADGDLIARTAEHLGIDTVRGSTTRGGMQAIRELLQISRRTHLVITPDGPKGPRRTVQPGVIFLAAQT